MTVDTRFPQIVPIKREEGLLTHYLGTYAAGKQFAGFVISLADDQPTVSVLHTFDAQGNHLHSDAWQGNDRVEVESLLENAIDKLENQRPGDIRIKLFSVERVGTRFELTPNEHGDIEYKPLGLVFAKPWNGTIVGVRLTPRISKE